MGFGGQKNWGRQEIFLVSGAVSHFLPVGWLRDCRAVTAHFVHSNAPCNDRLCR